MNRTSASKSEAKQSNGDPNQANRKRFESESKANEKRGLPVVEDMQTAELSVAFAEHEEEGITEVDEFGH